MTGVIPQDNKSHRTEEVSQTREIWAIHTDCVLGGYALPQFCTRGFRFI